MLGYPRSQQKAGEICRLAATCKRELTSRRRALAQCLSELAPRERNAHSSFNAGLARRLRRQARQRPPREESAMQVLDVLSQIPITFWGLAALFLAAAVTIESKSE